MTCILCGLTGRRSLKLSLLLEMLALKLVLLKKLVSELSFDASLGPFVSPAIGRLRERLSAMLAFEWLDAKVNAHVVKSARQAPESLIAL